MNRKAETILNLTALKMKIKNRMPLLLMIVVFAVFAGISATAETVIVTQHAKVYQSPNLSSPSISVSAGTVLKKTAEQSGWIRVEKSGRSAFMNADSVTEVVDLNGAVVYVAQKTPMYKTYGKAEQYGVLPVGTKLTAHAAAGDWICVGYADRKGFVKKSALTADKPADTTESAGSDAADNRPEVVVCKDKYAYAAAEGVKVYKSYSASSKVLATLPVNTHLAVGATCGDWAFVGLNGFYGFMKLSSLSDDKVAASPSEDAADTGDSVSTKVPEDANLGDSSTAPARGTAQAMDWWTSDIQNIFARGVTATITDVATGIAWKEIRKGGSSHADVQPLTKEDTAAMKAAVGKWSWDRRAIFVTIDGVNYAASMNCMPHGSGSIANNNFNGHHCIHFTNSRTHSSNKVCSLHQAAIQKALAAKL